MKYGTTTYTVELVFRKSSYPILVDKIKQLLSKEVEGQCSTTSE